MHSSFWVVSERVCVRVRAYAWVWINLRLCMDAQVDVQEYRVDREQTENERGVKAVQKCTKRDRVYW